MGDVVTARGYNFFEVLSALQKEIRRGKEKEALYWAFELATSGFEVALWNRLEIIAHEDIGAGNWGVIPFVDLCRRQYEGGRLPRGMVLANCILYMARSPKSRIGDEFPHVVMDQMARGELRLEIPDYALDMHTRRGRAMGRGMAHFVSEGAKLEPMSDISNPYKEIAEQSWLKMDEEKREGKPTPRLTWPKRKQGKAPQEQNVDNPAPGSLF